jgi:hypothetical protein
MKKVFIALALCLVMVSLIATPALAATQKVDLMKYMGPHPAAKAGYATFITNQGDGALVVRITVTNATARTKYQVHLLTECAQDYVLGTLTTNSKGKWGGQNEQYEFEQVLSAGPHTVSLELWPWGYNGTPPDPHSKSNIWSDNVTVNITKN